MPLPSTIAFPCLHVRHILSAGVNHGLAHGRKSMMPCADLCKVDYPSRAFTVRAIISCYSLAALTTLSRLWLIHIPSVFLARQGRELIAQSHHNQFFSALDFRSPTRFTNIFSRIWFNTTLGFPAGKTKAFGIIAGDNFFQRFKRWHVLRVSVLGFIGFHSLFPLLVRP